MCSLFSDPVPGSIPYDMAFDKIWYGLLSLEKYQKLKNVINAKDKLKQMLDQIAENFDQVSCNQKIEDLTKLISGSTAGRWPATGITNQGGDVEVVST